MGRFSFFRRVPIVLLLAHTYVGIRLAAAVPSGLLRWMVVLAIVLIYMLVIAGFASRRTTGRPSGDLLAWIGFLFLGLFSWLFVLTLLRDVLLLTVFNIQVISSTANQSKLFAQLYTVTAYAVPAISLFALTIGLFNARRLAKIVDVSITLPNLPLALHGYTLVQVTDLHVGPTIKKGYVNAVVNAVNALSPDTIVLTGDMVDGDVDLLRPHTQPLAKLLAPDGVYAVTGNHEYYSGATQWVAEFRRMGIQVLMNQHIVLSREGVQLVIAGVTDFGAEHFDVAQASNAKLALKGAPKGAAARILLAHQPRSAPAAAEAGFDLQLSGHTHGGQFWPWKYFVPLQQPFVAGLHRLGNMQVYVSRGTGYWGPPMRIAARSEITRIRLFAKP